MRRMRFGLETSETTLLPGPTLYWKVRTLHQQEGKGLRFAGCGMDRRGKAFPLVTRCWLDFRERLADS